MFTFEALAFETVDHFDAVTVGVAGRGSTLENFRLTAHARVSRITTTRVVETLAENTGLTTSRRCIRTFWIRSHCCDVPTANGAVIAGPEGEALKCDDAGADEMTCAVIRVHTWGRTDLAVNSSVSYRIARNTQDY